MIGIIDFVVSINKIALIAFFTVLAFLIFEIKKMAEEKKKKEKPVVPQFIGDITIQSSPVANSTPLPPPLIINYKKSEKTPIFLIMIGSISLLIILILTGISYSINQKKKKIASTPIPIVREIQSAGLKIYNGKWKEVKGEGSDQAAPGEKLYVGIKTIDEVDIDRARIKINAKDWQIADITTLFNPQLKVYYREYVVATGTGQLKIEAQLHSASDGWMGD